MRWVALATVPVALSLVPFAWHDAGAVRRELFAYGGVADFGWIAILRAVRFLATGVLARSEAVHWAPFVQGAKALFVIAYAFLLARWWRAARPPDLAATCMAVLLLFLTLYGALSAQYLLWVVPLGVLALSPAFAAYGVVTAIALIAFYAFLAPGVLGLAMPRELAGPAWAFGVAAQWLATAAWLVTHLRAERPA
jgi:hypothetical protein